MVAVPLHVRRFAPGACAILAAVYLSSAAAAPPPAPTSPTASDSLREQSDTLFYAGQYDSLFTVASYFARRAEASRDSVLLGRALTQRGRMLIMLGRPGAERDIDTAIHIAESVRDTTGLMPAETFKGFLHWGAGRYDDAIKCFERRLMLAQRVHSPVDEAWARVSLGYSFHNLGDQDRAKREYQRALELFHASGRRRQEIDALIGLGRVEGAIGNGPASIRWYRRALVASRETGDRMNEMWSANNLAVMETMQGDLSRSWEYLQHALALARELKSPYGMVVPAANLSKAFEELGDFESAQTVLDETRSLCESAGAAYQLPYLDYQLSILRIQQGRYANAAALLRKLMQSPESLEAQHRDLVVVYLARALASNDSTEAAIGVLSRYINTPGRHMYGDTAPTANLVVAGLYADAGSTRAALTYARRAQQAALPAGQKRPMVTAMLLESRCYRVAGNRERAASVFYAALDSLDAVRGGIGTPEWREVYGQSVSQDVIETARVLLEYPESSPKTERERAFFDAIQRVKTRTLLERINRPHAENADTTLQKPDRVATLVELQSRLQAGEAVLDFCAGTHGTYLAAVTPDSLRLVELPGPGSPLAERVQLLRTVLASTDPSLRAQYDVARLAEVQRALGYEILGRVADIIGRSTRLFICPDGYFSAVPFGLLITRDDGAVLMNACDVVAVPSASILVAERSRKEAVLRGVHVVAIRASGRGLSGAHAEVQDLARHYRSVNHFADLRDVNAFTQATSAADALHIASHAMVVDRSPWWSGIELRETSATAPRDAANVERKDAGGVRSGFLSDVDSLWIERAFPADPYVRAWQIAKLDIPARLVVLSACETAGGRITTGEGTLGLTSAFLSAGVPVVVSSLWPVDDRVTAIIMRSFYRHLAKGQSIATALRLAQLEVRGMTRYAHPFYWSGFTVVGDGARTMPIEKRLLPWNPLLLALFTLALLAAIVLFINRRRARAFVA